MRGKAVRILKGFNARKLNKHIDAPDKLEYDKIFVAEQIYIQGLNIYVNDI